MAKTKKAKANPKEEIAPNVEPISTVGEPAPKKGTPKDQETPLIDPTQPQPKPESTIGNPAPKVENAPEPAQKPTEQLTEPTPVGTPTIQVEPAQEPRPEKLLHTHDGSKALTAQEYERAQGIIK